VLASVGKPCPWLARIGPLLASIGHSLASIRPVLKLLALRRLCFRPVIQGIFFIAPATDNNFEDQVLRSLCQVGRFAEIGEGVGGKVT
jgi:hypothetical protein